MRTILTPALVLVSALLLTACEDELFVPDFNNPSLEDLSGNPSRSQLASAAVGLLVSNRLGYADFVRDVGILGRENYDLDGSDPRFVTELLRSPLDPGSRAFGGDHWLEPYASIRGANILLGAVDRATTITDPEKEALRGFAKTIQALDFLLIINTRDTNGAPIDVDIPIGELAPIVPKEAVLERIVTLLDEAASHLSAAGGSFPFNLSSGFDGFDTPATFLQFNRAVKARVEVYRGNFAAALQALNESFLTECSAFDRGVYHSYSTAAGDLPNPIFEDPTTADIRAHPSLETFAQTQPGGELDRRFLEKTFETEPKTQQDHTSDRTFTIYETAESPVPIIRNEELILLRAEANIGLGNIPSAATDLNCIRENVGGLAARSDLTAANALDELLYNKLFSLLFEGGHRWLDARRYGVQLPIDVPGDVVHLRYPIPRDEELPRGGG
ncbi:MAG: RagB/SusD family nutrient uptake outer membrane protein [Gemmatimonadota bacterium]